MTTLPDNTRELLLALHAEFYGGPLAPADAFRILPAVADELDRLRAEVNRPAGPPSPVKVYYVPRHGGYWAGGLVMIASDAGEAERAAKIAAVEDGDTCDFQPARQVWKPGDHVPAVLHDDELR